VSCDHSSQGDSHEATFLAPEQSPVACFFRCASTSRSSWILGLTCPKVPSLRATLSNMGRRCGGMDSTRAADINVLASTIACPGRSILKQPDASRTSVETNICVFLGRHVVPLSRAASFQCGCRYRTHHYLDSADRTLHDADLDIGSAGTGGLLTLAF
jgi:hypothetical protein